SSTVEDLLQTLARRHPSEFDAHVWRAPGQLLPSLMVCVGDQSIGNDLSRSLADGDEILLVSPVSGG
ncbi:MAG: MoaD/ThiS family protein, partial [Planctomycetales bacterium]|nr:MoaD/ThiS family protein [Planctomycetales bacterium]